MKQIDLDLHKYPASIRFKFLDLLNVTQKTTEIPTPGLNIVEHFLDKNRAGLKKRTETLSKKIGGEGNVVSKADGSYPLTSGKRLYNSLKFHNSSTLTAKCISSKESATKDVWNLYWSILPGEKYSKFKKDETIKKGNETYINGGTTFSTKFNPVGKNILLEFENFNLTKNEDKDYFEFSAWAPRFLEVTQDKVDTVDSVVDRAIKDRVFQAKTIFDGETIYHKGKDFDSYEEFAEDGKDKADPKLTKIIEKITKLKTEASEYSRDDKEKADYKELSQELSVLENQILEYLKKKGLNSYTVGETTISIRKIPTFYSITSERLAINSLKKAGLERFLIDNPLIDIPALKDFLNKQENENLKLEGISKKANSSALYIYRNFGEDIFIDDIDFELFYEMEGYDPKNLSPKVLADDWRLMCAHYQVYLATNGEGIKFTAKQILESAKKVITEIKERILAGKMNYSFNLKSLKPTSKSLYLKTRSRLSEQLQNVGEK